MRHVSSDSWLGVHLSGHTTVAIVGGGTATYVIAGSIDGQVLTQYPAPPAPSLSGTVPVTWSVGPETVASFTRGTHLLDMTGTVVFLPNAAGDTITVDSEYDAEPGAAPVVAAPVPAAPASANGALALLLGALGMVVFRARSRNGAAADASS